MLRRLALAWLALRRGGMKQQSPAAERTYAAPGAALAEGGTAVNGDLNVSSRQALRQIRDASPGDNEIEQSNNHAKLLRYEIQYRVMSAIDADSSEKQ